LPEETLVWAVTKSDTRWARLELGTKALFERVAALRCGLDRSAWEGDGTTCVNGLGIEPGKAPQEDVPLPFDVTRAHELYQALFGRVADIIDGKQLLIVSSGSLTQLPFGALVSKTPDPALVGPDAFHHAAWLIKSHAMTVLPGVSSLQALRQRAKISRATKAYIGFGNPLLDGPDDRYAGLAELARAKQHCPQNPSQRIAQFEGSGMKLLQERGDLVELSEIRSQIPLPETATSYVRWLSF
jgi:CHAT domain